MRMFWVVLCVCIVVCSPTVLAQRPIHPHDPPSRTQQLFALCGTIALVFGAFSFSFLLFRRKRVVPHPLVRKIARMYARMHNIAGWSALVLVLAHGAYFSVRAWGKPDAITGIIALCMLVVLVVFGMVLAKKRASRVVRRVHLILAVAWTILTIVHTVDALLYGVAIVLGSGALLWWAQRRPKAGAT